MSNYPYLKSYEELDASLQQLGLTLPLSDDLFILGKPLTFGGTKGCKKEYTLANRFVVQPMEGFDSEPDGAPSELCYRRYDRFAAGGASLIWFEATAVRHEGRCNSQQLWLHEGTVNQFADLLEKTRNIARQTCGHEIVSVLQLTHSGRYSKPTRGVKAPIVAQHNEVLGAPGRFEIPPDYPLITDDELDRLQDTFVEVAKLAARCGFEGVDIKACHGYLLNELLGARTRKGKYGGSYENRTRFIREIMTRVRDEVPEVFITSRMNAHDGVPYPWGFGVKEGGAVSVAARKSDGGDLQWDSSEPKQLARDLVKIGTPMLNIAIGNPYYNPHYNRPYAKNIRGAVSFDENPLIGICRYVDIVREVQASQPDIPMIGAGMGWLRGLTPRVAAGIIATGAAQLYGQGRGSFAYPNAPNDIMSKGAMDEKKVCMACSGCTELMRAEMPTGCVVHDQERYRLPN